MFTNNGNILLVSDEEQMLNRFQQAMEGDYNLFPASTIRQAHQLLLKYDMHVVLVKQKMSAMSGLQFCESISHDFPELTNIVLSTSNDTSSLKRAHKTGRIFQFIQSPYSDVELRMAIDNALKLQETKFEKRQLSERISEYENHQKEILELFKRYVPDEVVSQALNSNKEDIMKPGESRVVSVLFADMRNFTKLTDHLPPSEVVTFLNDFWNILSTSIKEHKGSVNKYIGDGLLAVFGAPVSYIDNHENAVKAALDMVGSLDKISEKYANKLGSEVNIGVGINSGEVIVGNVGTDDFMEYTVIGNTVNLASRLETISKEKTNSIIISEHTYELVKHAFQTTEIVETTLPKTNKKIGYCEVIGPKPGNVLPINPQSNIQ